MILQEVPVSSLIIVMAIAKILSAIDRECPEVIAILYVDDSIALVPIMYISQYVKTIETQAMNIRLLFNKNQSKIMPLYQQNTSIYIDKISTSNNYKSLGIIIDPILNFKEEINQRLK